MRPPLNDTFLEYMNHFRNNFKVHNPNILVFGHNSSVLPKVLQIESNQEIFLALLFFLMKKNLK